MTAAWPLVPLGDVLTHRKEFIQIDDMSRYKRCRVQLHAQGVVLRDEVPGAEIKTKKQQVCRPGEFLVAEIDAKLGGYGIVPPELDGAIVSSHYFLFGIDPDKLDRQFLDFYIRTPGFREQVEAQGSTNYAAIRPSHVLGYTMPLPPLAEQRRIVARVDAIAARVAEARRLREEATADTETLTQAESRVVFDPVTTDQIVPLAEVCAAIIDNLHSNPEYADSGVPCIRSPDVGWGQLILETARRTTEAEYLRRTVRGEPAPDDIVLVREGGGTCKAAIVQPGQRFSLGQRVMLLRPDTEKVLPRFLLYQLLSPVIYEDQILPLSTGSASPHLNIGALRKFPFRLPPLPDQRRIVAHLDALQAKANALRALQADTAAELNALLPAVLAKAFAGEL